MRLRIMVLPAALFVALSFGQSVDATLSAQARASVGAYCFQTDHWCYIANGEHSATGLVHGELTVRVVLGSGGGTRTCDGLLTCSTSMAGDVPYGACVIATAKSTSSPVSLGATQASAQACH